MMIVESERSDSEMAWELVHFQIDRERPEPLYRQLYECLNTGIATGQLRSGMRLPPTRQMARELGLSRQTVLAAYQELEADGRVTGQVGRGTFVL